MYAVPNIEEGATFITLPGKVDNIKKYIIVSVNESKKGDWLVNGEASINVQADESGKVHILKRKENLKPWKFNLLHFRKIWMLWK